MLFHDQLSALQGWDDRIWEGVLYPLTLLQGEGVGSLRVAVRSFPDAANKGVVRMRELFEQCAVIVLW
eukprot:gene11270-biopygen800